MTERKDTNDKQEQDICVILGVLIESERLSYADEKGVTALHNRGSEDYLYLNVDDPKLKGTYILVEKGLIRKLIGDAIQNGEASLDFDVNNLTVDSRPTPDEHRYEPYMSYQKDYEEYRGNVSLSLKVPQDYVLDLRSWELSYYTTGSRPDLEFIVETEGDTEWS